MLGSQGHRFPTARAVPDGLRGLLFHYLFKLIELNQTIQKKKKPRMPGLGTRGIWLNLSKEYTESMERYMRLSY